MLRPLALLAIAAAPLPAQNWEPLLDRLLTPPPIETPAPTPAEPRASASGPHPHLAAIFEHHGLPADLLWIAKVESAFQPHALSKAGALGLWQLMPATAQRYGLQTGGGPRDERRDPIKSGHAAARYLKDLFHTFHDWPLALAAYNAGEGAVQKALKQNRASTFHELRTKRALPAETLNYVPAVLAAQNAAAQQLSDNSRHGSAARAPQVLYAPAGLSR